MEQSTSKKNWYAIRAVPGSQRMAKTITIKPANGETIEEVAEIAKRRTGESILERDCRRNGIEVFMPGFWNTIQHNRTKKLIDRRFPFLVGYAFVCIEMEKFEKVRNLTSVIGFVRNAFGPIKFDDEIIGSLAVAEMERRHEFDVERFDRETRNRDLRRNMLNRKLGLIMPKGRRKKLPLRMVAEAEISKLSGRTRDRVEEILKMLDELDAEASGTCNQQIGNVISAA